jgi:capsular exopolysaccharide synthesis family protein
MGRLENAMRRAAGEQAVPAVDLPQPAEDFADDLPNEVAPPVLESAQDAPVEPGYFPNELAPMNEFGRQAEIAAPAAAPVPDAAPEMMLRSQVNSALATKTVIDHEMMPASREQYRRLAAALHQAQRTTGFKVVMVASAVAGEGKTLTASNLAMTLSESYRRDVLLIDADLRRPSLHLVFQVPGAPGLSDGLITSEDPKLPLHRVSERLAILPAGRPTSDPIGALTSERMRRLIDEAREVFDWVVIDTPPVGLLTDAALLSSMADGVVLVVKAESTPHDMVVRAVNAIGRERVIGTVLNRAKEQPNRTSYDYYKYYSQAEPGSLVAKR